MGQRLVPPGIPGHGLNAICSAGPWKNILLGGLGGASRRAGSIGRARRALGQVGAGPRPPKQELSRPTATGAGPSPPPKPGWLQRPPATPLSAAGDAAVTRGSSPVHCVEPGTWPGWGPGAGLCLKRRDWCGIATASQSRLSSAPFRVFGRTLQTRAAVTSRV